MPKRRRGIKPLVKHERAYQQDVIELMLREFVAPLRTALVGYDPEVFLRTIKAIERRLAQNPRFGQEEADRAIQQLSAYQRARFNRIAQNVSIELGIFGGAGDRMVAPILQKALVENVGLIKNLASDYGEYSYQQVEGIIRKTGFDLGAQQAEVQSFLSKEGDSTRKIKNRAKLITRDQNNKIIGELNQARHKSVGGRRYEWSTSVDERVRGNHIHLNGSIQRWDTPPTGGGTAPGEAGHPGHGIQCRCIANFIFETQEK